MTTTPNLGITYLEGNQDSEEVTVNSALNVVDALLNHAIISRTIVAEPGLPVDGDVYLIPAGATGANWLGQDGNIGIYYTGWTFYAPKEGWEFRVEDEDVTILYDGSAWWEVHNDQLLSPPAGHRCMRPLLPLDTSGAFSIVSQTAYFLYLGQTHRAITPKYVAIHLITSGSGITSKEVGFFSTPLPPNKSGQTLTKLVSDNLGAIGSSGVKRNLSSFATSIASGTHLWAGIMINATGMPSCFGAILDMGSGSILTKTLATTFATTSTYAGAVLSASSSSIGPILQGEMD